LRFLNQGLQEDREAFVQAQQRQQQLRAELLASLERIDRQETRLEAIRKELKKLAQPHDLKVTAEQLYAIGQAIQKQLAESDGGPK
jgi:hemoglobin-like flavoprotein